MTIHATVDLFWRCDRYEAVPGVTWWGDAPRGVSDYVDRAIAAAHRLQAALGVREGDALARTREDVWLNYGGHLGRLDVAGGLPHDVTLHLGTFDLDELERNSA